jgi:hypothetical protein
MSKLRWLSIIMNEDLKWFWFEDGSYMNEFDGAIVR